MHEDYSVKNYRENAAQQLREWVQGNPVHNPLSPLGDRPIEYGGECCPDFSCCVPSIMEKDPNKRMHDALAACERIDWLTPDMIFPHKQ